MGEKVETKNETEKKPVEGGKKKDDAPTEVKAADGGGKKDEGPAEKKDDGSGEKKTAEDGGKNDEGTGEQKVADGGGNKDGEGPTTVVLKLEWHCEGCAKKVRRSIRQFEGVETVKADYDAKKLTVTGTVDPAWLREKVESKTKKKVELISPQPKKDGGAGGATTTAVDSKAEEKSETKTEERKADDVKKTKEAVVSTVVMKIRLHCDGCAHKIKRVIIKNVNGANLATTDLQKDLVTVTGTMDPKELAAYLEAKLKRAVEIVPPKKADVPGEKEAGGKREKDGGGGGGGGDEKKQVGGVKKVAETKAATGGGGGAKGIEETKVEARRMEYMNGVDPHTHYAMPMSNQNYAIANQDYGVPMYHHHQGYSSTGHAVHYTQGPPPLPPPTYLNMDDQMFSDENPNGCSVM